MNKRILSLIGLTLLLTACEKPVPVKYAQVCDLANDGKLVESTGFLDDGGGVYCSNTRDRNTVDCGFKFKDNLSDKKYHSAEVARGTGSNMVGKLESGYKSADIKIKDHQGNVINRDKKVKLTVRVRSAAAPSPKSSAVCYLVVKKIEQL